jgi:beta-lactamase regulating signal transducer with metallopeptidase domain
VGSLVGNFNEGAAMTLGILWASGGFLLRVICGVSAVWIAAAVGGLLLRRSSAALRHRIWAMSTVAALGLPLAVLMLPEWRVGLVRVPAPAVPKVSTPLADVHASPGSLPTASAANMPIRTYQSASPGPATNVPARIAPPVPPTPQPSRRSDASIDRPINWGMCFAVIWLVPAIWLLLRQFLASLAGQSLPRRATVIETGPARVCLSNLLNRLGITIQPRLLQSPEIPVPVCMGSIHPCILLPDHAPAWPAEQLESVLTHELAHIARRDVLWQMLSRLACAIYWLHPLAWFAAWRMRVERELACDDWVLRGGQSSTRYARWLLDIATMLSTRRHCVESIGVAMAARTNLEHRISALLDPRRRRFPVSRPMAITLTIAAAALLITIASLNPLAPKPANAQSAQGQSKAIATTKPLAPVQKVVRISGRVEDEQGKPASDAVVETDGPHIRRCSSPTDTDGRFTLEVPGEELSWARLRASTRDGTKQTFHEFSDIISIKDAHVRDLRMTLQPARQFDVTVNDDKGHAVAGAWVVGVAQYMVVGEALTDAAGKTLLRMPANVSPEYILVTKADVGTDYVMFWGKDQPHTDPYRLAPDFAGPLTFVLNGTKTVTVRVLDEQQRPVKGVVVYPWTLDKPKKGEDANISCIAGFHQLTDERGIVEFRMIPADQTTAIVFWTRLDGYCAPNRSVWDPKSGKTELPAQMLRQIRITGRVVDAEGRPAGGAIVRFTGMGNSEDGLHNQQDVAADDGRFEADVDPELYCMFVASKGQLVSKASFQIIRREAPASVELKLEPAIRVYGQVTGGLDHTPVSGATVSLIQRDDGSYYKLSKDEQFPGATTGRTAIVPSIAQHVKSDDKGIFEFYVAPGDCEYVVRVSSGASQQTQRFILPGRTECTLIHDIGSLPQNALAKEARTIDATKGLELNFYSAITKPKADVLNGHVVLRDNPNTPVPEATLTGAHVGHEGFFVEGTADRQGNFTVRRGKSDLYLYATTADKKLQGIVKVKASEDNITVPIGPTASARGRLLDTDGNVLAGRVITFGVRIDYPRGVFGFRFGGETKTGDDGSFVVEGLVPGFEYSLNFVTDFDSKGHPYGSRAAGKVKAERPERVELGDLRLPAPYRPRQ